MQPMSPAAVRAAAQAGAAVTALAVIGYAMALSGPGPAAAGQVRAEHVAHLAAAGRPAHRARPSVRRSRPSRPSQPPRQSRQERQRPPHPAAAGPRDVGGRALASTGIVVAPGARKLPSVPASAYVIANARTGQVLAAKDPHGRFPPASTLKVLTAITMLPRLRPGASITATRLAASMVPNVVGLIPGHRYRVADLFRALLLISANDAAVSLIQASGSFAHGMALVNAEARHLRAYDVVAKTPNGLPAPGQVVSAYDLALIARAALGMPAFMAYDRTLSAMFYRTRFGPVHMVNENALLTQYPGALGGKIGWTMAAGATYVGMARRHGVTLIVTILHAKPLTEIASAERLLTWGFAENGHLRPIGTLVGPRQR
jgi:serine-type D-Ala-D-Ala carboxypeptidase (penicillin-binding protein 5/6)